MNRNVAPLLAVLVLLAACSAQGGLRSSDEPGPSSPPPSGSDDGDGHTGSPGAGEAVLVIDSAGGFVPVEFMTTRLPTFVMLGDGRVIMQGMQTLEFPGPALPPLIERTLTDEGVDAVLGAVDDTNLFAGDVDFRGAQNVVADAADTLFILNAGGREVTVSIYGLGTLPPEMEPPPGFPSGELQAHETLQRLHDALISLDTWLPGEAWEDEGWKPYEPEAFRLYVRDVTGEPSDPELPEQLRDWPTDDDPAAFGEEQATFSDGTRCGVVDGELGATWFEQLSAANQNTLWTDDGERRFRVLARPLLPHDEAICPELAGA